ncbi:MAG: sulfotransferase domain-containing protein [Gammaproteobacteria bacterium]|nr:sulfotransferase domain-containing protein [Gammaproteobacteria bacterium]
MGKVPTVCAVDYPGFTFDVVSPELPCGAAWLANCFLELNIPVWRPWDYEIDNEWKRLAPFHYQYADNQQPWKQTLPALQYLREFQFNPAYAACFHHQWPISYRRKRRLIFFVRDPRDALFSYWRRTTHNEPDFCLSFESFVHSRYFHHPFSFREYLLIFLQLWKNHLSGHNHLIIRFEDYRNNARQTLNRVLGFLNMQVEEDKISYALECSDFSTLKGIEDQMEKNAQLKHKFSHAGIAFEYQKSYTPAMHACLGTDFDDVCKWLGYTSHADAYFQSNTNSVCKKQVDALVSLIDSPVERKRGYQQNHEVSFEQLSSGLHFNRGLHK